MRGCRCSEPLRRGLRRADPVPRQPKSLPSSLAGCHSPPSVPLSPKLTFHKDISRSHRHHRSKGSGCLRLRSASARLTDPGPYRVTADFATVVVPSVRLGVGNAGAQGAFGDGQSVVTPHPCSACVTLQRCCRPVANLLIHWIRATGPIKSNKMFQPKH